MQIRKKLLNNNPYFHFYDFPKKYYSPLLSGLDGDDDILAGAGADTINGGAGADLILAGDGDDMIIGSAGGDDIDGGAGYDTLTFEGSDVAVRADLEARIGQGGYAQGDIYTNIEALIGSSRDDELGGDLGDNRIEGRDGNDILLGYDGIDILLGGNGDDWLTGGLGADTLDGGEGIDTADYFFADSGVNVLLTAGTATGGEAEGDTLISIENLIGTEFDDVLTGSDQANILRGGRGNDVIDGGDGDDLLIGRVYLSNRR